MEERAPVSRAHIWERVLEIGFALAVVIGLTAWIIIDRRNNQNQTDTGAGSGLNVVTTAPIKINLAYVTNGLKHVTGMAHIPGNDRLYLAQQSGVVKVYDDGQLQEKAVIDISAKVRNGGEQGLIGIAIDPLNFSNPYIYLHYSDTKDGASIVARYTFSADGSTADPKTEKIILRQPQPFPNHNGGQLEFGPDNYLYIGFGDGGSANDPLNNGQSLATWLGKILRIDVHSGNPYSVPEDNPFVKTAGAKPEIWNLGLRNPWRFSFDASNKQMIIGDVGQGEWEEVSVEPAGKGGKNYGWRCYEAKEVFNETGCKTANNYVMPRVEYSHEQGRCSITGGYVYNGTRLNDIKGRYIYGDFCSGEIWSIKYTDSKDTPRLEMDTNFMISSFGEDNTGNVYVTDYEGGVIYRLVHAV